MFVSFSGLYGYIVGLFPAAWLYVVVVVAESVSRQT
jgi:hypothetical protein